MCTPATALGSSVAQRLCTRGQAWNQGTAGWYAAYLAPTVAVAVVVLSAAALQGLQLRRKEAAAALSATGAGVHCSVGCAG
jgi:anti-sigma-K factor RskA